MTQTQAKAILEAQGEPAAEALAEVMEELGIESEVYDAVNETIDAAALWAALCDLTGLKEGEAGGRAIDERWSDVGAG